MSACYRNDNDFCSGCTDCTFVNPQGSCNEGPTIVPQVPIESDCTQYSTTACFRWPMIKEFRHERIMIYINNYISFWKIPNDIKYKFTNVTQHCWPIENVYHITAIFYLPNNCGQMSDATCEVVFSVTVSNFLPVNAFVYVIFRIEGYPEKFLADDTYDWQYAYIYETMKHNLHNPPICNIPKPCKPNPVICQNTGVPSNTGVCTNTGVPSNAGICTNTGVPSNAGICTNTMPCNTKC